MSPLKDFSRHKSSAGAKSYQYKSAVENFSGGGAELYWDTSRDEMSVGIQCCITLL